jgi:hypothetical protein
MRDVADLTLDLNFDFAFTALRAIAVSRREIQERLT